MSSLPHPGTATELYLAAILAELRKLNNGSAETKQSASDEVDLVEPKPKRKKRKSRVSEFLDNKS